MFLKMRNKLSSWKFSTFYTHCIFTDKTNTLESILNLFNNINREEIQTQSQSVTCESSLVDNRKSTGNSCLELQNFVVFFSFDFILLIFFTHHRQLVFSKTFISIFFSLTFFSMETCWKFCIQVFARIYLILHSLFAFFLYSVRFRSYYWKFKGNQLKLRI
jgi:hypothetical protein